MEAVKTVRGSTEELAKGYCPMPGYKFGGSSSSGAGDTTCWYFVDGIAAGNRNRSGGKRVPGESPDMNGKCEDPLLEGRT